MVGERAKAAAAGPAFPQEGASRQARRCLLHTLSRSELPLDLMCRSRLRTRTQSARPLAPLWQASNVQRQLPSPTRPGRPHHCTAEDSGLRGQLQRAEERIAELLAGKQTCEASMAEGQLSAAQLSKVEQEKEAWQQQALDAQKAQAAAEGKAAAALQHAAEAGQAKKAAQREAAEAKAAKAAAEEAVEDVQAEAQRAIAAAKVSQQAAEREVGRMDVELAKARAAAAASEAAMQGETCAAGGPWPASAKVRWTERVSN